MIDALYIDYPAHERCYV